MKSYLVIKNEIQVVTRKDSAGKKIVVRFFLSEQLPHSPEPKKTTEGKS